MRRGCSPGAAGPGTEVRGSGRGTKGWGRGGCSDSSGAGGKRDRGEGVGKRKQCSSGRQEDSNFERCRLSWNASSVRSRNAAALGIRRAPGAAQRGTGRRRFSPLPAWRERGGPARSRGREAVRSVRGSLSPPPRSLSDSVGRELAGPGERKRSPVPDPSASSTAPAPPGLAQLLGEAWARTVRRLLGIPAH